MCSFRKTGFQIADMFNICSMVCGGRGNAEAGKELTDSVIDVEMMVG